MVIYGIYIRFWPTLAITIHVWYFCMEITKHTVIYGVYIYT
jgi:hypothetical protein